MFNFDEFYGEENGKVSENFKMSIQEIKNIHEETLNYEVNDEKSNYDNYLNVISKFILETAELEQNVNDEYFTNKTFDELKEENYRLYNEMLPENYKTSYANPTYGVQIFGDNIGQTLAAFYFKIRENIKSAYTHKLFDIEKNNRMFIEVYKYIKNNEVKYEELKGIYSKYATIDVDKNYEYYIKENFSKDFDFYSDIILNSDLNDLRYLFKYGKYITDNEIKTAEFLMNYPKDKLKTLTESIAKAYVNGFIRDNKDISKRINVRLICNAGQELIIRSLVEDLKARNLHGYVAELLSTDYNKQYDYDHKFDNALYLNEVTSKMNTEAFKKATEINADKLKDYSGVLLVEKFGEEPFSPENKKEKLKLCDEQLKLYQVYRNEMRANIEKHLPEKETSFCIVAFPTPEIGDNFEEIFEDILKVNMLDSEKYERIQQVIIDALDKGEFVHVKGTGKNKTDIKVKLHELKNPEKETNFVNCVADVNIPVGEVFTSPTLKETNGVLHIDEVYLECFKYYNLELTFKDGYVAEYTCTNFDNEDANKQYIKENLLFPHDTLPLGEFAIGTNTLAYVIAEKYGIIEKLPILIVEKMGPHFAIGDTCFSWGEDNPVYNPLDKKEIIARDNEKSILRKTNVQEAYTNCHTDITLPYDGLEHISVITKENKTIEIIRDGRFVLEGTEELNKPF